MAVCIHGNISVKLAVFFVPVSELENVFPLESLCNELINEKEDNDMEKSNFLSK